MFFTGEKNKIKSSGQILTGFGVRITRKSQDLSQFLLILSPGPAGNLTAHLQINPTDVVLKQGHFPTDHSAEVLVGVSCHPVWQIQTQVCVSRQRQRVYEACPEGLTLSVLIV